MPRLGTRAQWGGGPRQPKPDHTCPVCTFHEKQQLLSENYKHLCWCGQLRAGPGKLLNSDRVLGPHMGFLCPWSRAIVPVRAPGRGDPDTDRTALAVPGGATMDDKCLCLLPGLELRGLGSVQLSPSHGLRPSQQSVCLLTKLSADEALEAGGLGEAAQRGNRTL